MYSGRPRRLRRSQAVLIGSWSLRRIDYRHFHRAGFGVEAPSGDATLLAEVLAPRTILLNLHFHLCSGTTVTAETMQRLIERADQDK